MTPESGQQERSSEQTHPTWAAFAARHPGQEFLKVDPLYALRENVIDAIQDEIPDFFSAEEEAFERDLARTTRHGFFLCRPIEDWPNPPSGEEPSEHPANATAQ